MPFIPAPGTIRVDTVGLLFGQRIENVWDVSTPDAIDAIKVQSAASDVSAAYVSHIVPLLSHMYSYILAESQDISVEDGVQGTHSPTSPVAGGSAEDSMPGGTALCVSLRTSRAGRSFRGRKFFSALARSQVVSNQVGASYANDFVTAVNQMIVDLAGLGWTLVIVSRQHNKVARTTAEVTPILTATVVDYNVDSQRRRLTGRGT